MAYSNEKPIVLVVVTFFLALTLVYIVYFRVQSAKNNDTATPNNVVTQSGSQFSSTNLWDDHLSLWWSWFITGTNQWSDMIAAGNLSPLETKIRTLSWGVRPRYSSISVADQLGLSYTTAFVDDYGIQYGYLGTGINNELAATVRRLWWNVLAIETRNDIISNLLRWDRVSFVNIPGTTFTQQWTTEQRLLVAMIVTIGEDRWFIQSPIDQYYVHKSDMKTHFEQIYDKVW